MQIKRNKKDT